MFQLPRALLQAWRTIGRFRPALVLGLGGYGSAPVVLAAWVRGLPTVLLEQNARPGLANRLLARLACRVCTAFAESAAYFPPRKSVHTGNPVRRLAPESFQRGEHFTVFAFGGSQGARSINRAMVEAAVLLKTALPGTEIIHQAGEVEAELVREGYRAAGVAAEVSAFIDNMGKAYGRADLVVCRSGATTLAELAALGKPAILVPYPHAADDHQRANAEVVVARGAAEMILDRELSGERLAARIRDLATDPGRLERMRQAAFSLAVSDAATAVLQVCREVVKEKR
jgi:UDP-N-acetylglucosamine--N-acetylmuramyl-(pentapeptide) pyrophosphoryl-undecaprenol N-acetylglucosamine transferase